MIVGALQDKKYSLACSCLATHSSHEAKSLECLVQQKCDFSYSLIICTIYTLITHRNGKEPIERKTLRKVSTTHPPYQRELLILREISLQSLLIPSHIVIPIERRFLPKYYPYPFRVLSVFGTWEALEDAKDGGCNMGLLRDLVSQRKQDST